MGCLDSKATVEKPNNKKFFETEDFNEKIFQFLNIILISNKKRFS